MEPISLLPIKDTVAQVLRREILACRLEDGAELIQEAVASQLNVSRIPVREAFLCLEGEGLLERLPNRHMRVIGLTGDRLRQNFRVLAALEAELAEQTLSAGKTGPVWAALDRCSAALESRDWDALWAADRALHLSFSAGLDNPALRQLHERERQALFEGVLDAFPPDWERLAALDTGIGEALHTWTGLSEAIINYYSVLAESASKELKQLCR